MGVLHALDVIYDSRVGILHALYVVRHVWVGVLHVLVDSMIHNQQ